MKYRLVYLEANAAGIYQAPKGWHVVQFCEPNWNDIKHPVWAWIQKDVEA